MLKTDVVVIGSGVGGLSCAALLARYGFEVIVCESHSIAGGQPMDSSVRGLNSIPVFAAPK